MTSLQNQSAAERVALIRERLVDYLARYEQAHYPEAVFAYEYLLLTKKLELALAEGEPAFLDPPWVADLATSLAAEYFSTMDAIDRWVASSGDSRQSKVVPNDLPEVVPEPWREVYVASRGSRSYVLEDALFAMMAHISYDLPIALLHMADRMDVSVHIADFHRMNDVLGTAIDGIQDDLASRYSWALADLDLLFTGQDELFSNYGIRLSRGMAWYNFERLTDPLARAAAEESIKRSTGALIKQLREPDDWKLRMALRMARLLIPERRQWPSRPLK
ncbi:hypothetical protein EV652_1035 [Kribbella steppae]|uniref:Uncharacterized protein n=1 Tax=Kribbella steppae TaxID=2512223 RepID=A0A4R2HQ53_9ACTN|nr:DUF5995 family protein [Kribbella steppae]TCO33006.1 hypothetical protein EV652_1035 [Kribbella steppae]